MSSTAPIIDKFPLPNSILSVEGDPTLWGLSELDTVIAPQLTAGDPVAFGVITPLAGTLLLAARNAGNMVLSPLPPGGGWVPCVKLQSPYLYLPSTTGVAAHSPGYMLTGPNTDLAALQQAIMTAMQDGTLLTVNVDTGGTTGMIVVNGAKLPFAVLAEAEPAAG